MFKKRTAIWGLLAILAAIGGSLVGSGCAIYRGDRNTVQPLALDKKQFEGEWYYQKTLIDAPYDAVGVFIGATGEGYKIRWEITERFLYAYTTRPNVLNADSTVVPVAAWPIIGHFTIRYAINYSTGQPSNVVVEDYLDKPWYERPNFRVAWERMVITDFTNLSWYYRLFGFFVQEIPTNVRPEEVIILKDYMDIVNEEIISPGISPLISKLNTGLPISAYRIRYRHSFKKVTPSTYTPRPMNDDQFAKFGFFRTTLIKYHPDRGLVDWSYQYLANRFNVAHNDDIVKKLNELKKKNPKATRADACKAMKKPCQIVYYLSPNFPEEIKDTAYLMVKDWNKAFQRALQRPGEDIFVLKENDDGLPKGQIRKIGDIRYNFLYWVAKPISFGLLGYGPSFADYDTGEIIHASAYVYGAVVRRVVDRFLLLYDMVSGRYTDEDLRNGRDYLDIINNFNGNKGGKPLTKVNDVPIKAPEYAGFDIKKAIQEVKSPLFKLKLSKLRLLDRAYIQARLSIIDKRPDLKWAMMPDEIIQAYFPNTDIERLKYSPDEKAKQILDSYLNPANLLRVSGLREAMRIGNELSKRNVILASYVDPALTKFVKANKNLSRQQLKLLMTKMIFRGTETHEIGHTIGLRHNFSASADEPNYFPEYFELKKKQGGNIVGSDNDHRHRWFYMYSSIMDYHGEYYGDAMGPGPYDHAAIMYGYGNLLEMEPDGDKAKESLAELQEYLDKVVASAKKLPTTKYKGIFKSVKIERNKLKFITLPGFDGEGNRKFFRSDQVLLHVKGVTPDGKEKTIIKLTADDLSGIEKLHEVKAIFGVKPKRAITYYDGTISLQNNNFLWSSPLRRRYYRFCSDDLVGQDPYCTRFDSGSNPKEMVDNMIRRYDGTYPLRNWNRGRRYFRLGSGYLYRLINQFSLISIFFQNWIWRVIYEDGFQGSHEFFEQLAAVRQGVAFLSRLIHTPEPGPHVYDPNEKAYVLANNTSPSSKTLNVPVGVGRYFYSKLMQDELGLSQYRFERIGIMYDKYVALMALAIRDWGLNVNAINFFYVNFYDYLSSDDVSDIFTEAISGDFSKKYSFTYNDIPIKPNWHPILQYTGIYMALTLLNSGFFGNTFTHYMTVGIVGSGQGWSPPPGKEGQVISFTNASGTRKYFAVQTEDGRSIAYKLVAKGKKLSDRLRALRALPTGAVNQAEVRNTEAQLVWIETVLQMMKSYVNLLYGG